MAGHDLCLPRVYLLAHAQQPEIHPRGRRAGHAGPDARDGEGGRNPSSGRQRTASATLYVYWDFSQQQIEQAFTGLGPGRAILKLWNARGSDLVREAEVHLDARGWYVRELPPGSELRVELWAVGPLGARMLRAARPVKLPAASPSDVTEAFYLKLPLDQALPQGGLSAGRPLNYGGSAPPGWERRLQPRPFAGSSFGGPFGSSPGGKLPWSATHP